LGVSRCSPMMRSIFLHWGSDDLIARGDRKTVRGNIHQHKKIFREL
jgi:hypothetical protein